MEDMDPSNSSEFNSPPSSNSAAPYRQFHLAHTKILIKIYIYVLAISKLFHSINPISLFLLHTLKRVRGNRILGKKV
jgi:hypothetical protein